MIYDAPICYAEAAFFISSDR